MPKIFTIKGYIVYFWSNENDEPIHVHVAKGAPRPNATKIWLTKSGGDAYIFLTTKRSFVNFLSFEYEVVR